MEVTTLRLPGDLLEELDAEADELGFSSRSEYIRHLLRNRSEYAPNTDTEAERIRSEYASEYADKLSELEERLEQLEQRPTTGQPEFKDPRGDPRREKEPDGGGDDLREQMEERLDELDVPGRKTAVEATRRRVIKYAWETLREEGTIDAGDLQKDLMGKFFEDPNLGYSVSKRNPGYQLWDNCVRDRLVELPGVVAPGQRGSEYRFSQ